MEAILSNPIIMMLVVSSGAIGFAICWFGGLIAALTALGNKRWLWGISILFLGPLTGIPYSFIYKEADYPRSLMIKGIGLLAVAGLVYLLSLIFA